ncbi:MAG: serine/threonine-protein kinase, partial [Phycisphaerales bacterium]|nr:serine/threonine-protein kinase [Phycisphaerales bacterium]
MPRAPDEFDSTISEATVLSDQYEVLRKLGEGGMGEVHLATDRHLNDRLVAIKTLPALRVASKRAMTQLRREAAAMAELTHEHIVRFFHFGEHERIPFMVLQYIEGQTLDDVLGEQETLSPDEVIAMCGPLGDALDYAHSKGIIHRDVKPSNVFIDSSGKPYLADFGIARIAKDTITQV